jgi:hypothetical protein
MKVKENEENEMLYPEWGALTNQDPAPDEPQTQNPKPT